MSRTDNIIARFPDFYQSEETENLFYEYISVFAALLDAAEEDMLGIMRTHWVKRADNAGSKGFDAAQKGDLDKIFALYLESLGGTALLKQGDRHADTEGGKADDDLYRTRVLSVINVLKNGASTKQGIIDIIAANLGIAPDMPFANEAKASIRIVEFLPKLVKNDVLAEPVELFAPFAANNSSETGKAVSLFVPFIAKNPSKTETIPEFHFRLNIQNTANSVAIPALFNLRVVNTQTGQFIRFNGTIKAGDTFAFLSNGTGLLRGVEFKPEGQIILPSGDSMLRIEAELGFPVGKFDQNTLFDFAQFDVPTERPIGQFDRNMRFGEAVFNYDKPFAMLDIQYLKLTPGTFTAVVPWDIAGFSVTIKITARTLVRLKTFGVPQNQMDAIATLKDRIFQTLGDFYEKLHELLPETKENTEGALRLKKLIFQEAELSDKYARLNISPRAQIGAIVNRVKAAGVYAEINFEKRFVETQELGESFSMKGIRTSFVETHEMTENDFSAASVQTSSVTHELSETLRLSGVFDFTRFDSLNRFA